MYTINFNNELFAVIDDFDKAVGLAVNLHHSSNKPHSINVLFEEKVICYFFS